MIRLFALSIIILALTGCAKPDLKDATAEKIRRKRLGIGVAGQRVTSCYLYSGV
jgi:hypothetical protein